MPIMLAIAGSRLSCCSASELWGLWHKLLAYIDINAYLPLKKTPNNLYLDHTLVTVAKFQNS